MRYGATLRAFNAPWNRCVQFLLEDESVPGMRSVGLSVNMQTVEQGYEVSPTFELSRNQAQVLMDDLWNAGLRPTEGTGSAGSLAATEKHLNDMRKIAGAKLGVEL